MRTKIEDNEWSKFLASYSESYSGRPTRLGIFNVQEGFANEYWLEDGLPLIEVSLSKRSGRPEIDIMLERYTHSIEDPIELLHVDQGRSDTGIDIKGKDGAVTVLRVENVERSTT